MVIFIGFGGFLSIAGILIGGQFAEIVLLTGIAQLFMAGVLLWSNVGLKNLVSSRRIYPILLYGLVIILPSFVGIGIPIYFSAFMLIMIILHIYVLYMHKPTVELFK